MLKIFLKARYFHQSPSSWLYSILIRECDLCYTLSFFKEFIWFFKGIQCEAKYKGSDYRADQTRLRIPAGQFPGPAQVSCQASSEGPWRTFCAGVFTPSEISYCFPFIVHCTTLVLSWIEKAIKKNQHNMFPKYFCVKVCVHFFFCCLTIEVWASLQQSCHQVL